MLERLGPRKASNLTCLLFQKKTGVTPFSAKPPQHFVGTRSIGLRFQFTPPSWCSEVMPNNSRAIPFHWCDSPVIHH
jgi:hypothetical protein